MKLSNKKKQQVKDFIQKELIPFVLRENGRGFGMELWNNYGNAGKRWDIDGVYRVVPKCGRVACIGGSIETLRPRAMGEHVPLGLTQAEGKGLFYGWDIGDPKYYENKYCWPKQYRDAYKRAKTTLGKAKVACQLLKQIAEKGAKALEKVKR